MCELSIFHLELVEWFCNEGKEETENSEEERSSQFPMEWIDGMVGVGGLKQKNVL